jgi:hypothetical protein
VVVGPFSDDIDISTRLLRTFVGPTPAVIADDMNVIRGVYIKDVARRSVRGTECR